MLVALAAASVVAQQSDQRQQAQDRMAEYSKRLKLTDDQKKLVGDILKDDRQKAQEIRQKYQGQQTPDKNAMMQDLKALQDDVNGRVSKVLDSSQMQEWKKIQQENQARRRGNKQSRRQQTPQ
jgi:hypothetical protein